MKKVGIIAALAAIICGIAVYLYIGSVEQRVEKANRPQEMEMTEIVVAAKLIPPYTEITSDMLRMEAFPAQYASRKAAKSIDDVVGYQADGTIVEGETILLSMLGTPEDIGASLSFEVPDGMRAMTVNVGIDSGVGGYITKGDMIDLMLYLPVTPEEEEEDEEIPEEEKTEITGNKLISSDGETYVTAASLTSVVLEAAVVLELGDTSFNPENGGVYGSVTLALTPEDCLKLFAAKKQAEAGGDLYAVLRQRGDNSPSDTGIYSFATVME